eukprot:c19152_g1_i1 orf=185-442(-)
MPVGREGFQAQFCLIHSVNPTTFSLAEASQPLHGSIFDLKIDSSSLDNSQASVFRINSFPGICIQFCSQSKERDVSSPCPSVTCL